MEYETAIIIGGVAIGADGTVTPADTDPLDRVPDTVTFEFSGAWQYVVSGDTVTIEPADNGELVSVSVWGRGELVATYQRGDTIEPADYELVTRSADLAGVSVVAFIHGVPA